jgi:AraC-like DNA-binding protein
MGGDQKLVPGAATDTAIDAAAALKLEALAVVIARRIPVGSLGLLDYALCTSPDLRESMRRLTRYFALVTQRVKLVLEVRDGQARLVFNRDGRAARQWVEFASAMIAERLRQAMGSSMRYSLVSFIHGPPKKTTAHDWFFGVKVRFGATHDVLAFPAVLLDSPVRTAAAALGGVLEGHEAARADPRRAAPRTGLLDEARRACAHQLLEDPSLTVTEVVHRLAFSDPSAFFRAFRRWTGQSPKATRGRLSLH